MPGLLDFVFAHPGPCSVTTRSVPALSSVLAACMLGRIARCLAPLRLQGGCGDVCATLCCRVSFINFDSFVNFDGR